MVERRVFAVGIEVAIDTVAAHEIVHIVDKKIKGENSRGHVCWNDSISSQLNRYVMSCYTGDNIEQGSKIVSSAAPVI